MTCGLKRLATWIFWKFEQRLTWTIKKYCFINIQGVCESVLFGMPLILRPTACWKLDWEELEQNQQSFAALCHMLQHKVWRLNFTVTSDR